MRPVNKSELNIAFIVRKTVLFYIRLMKVSYTKTVETWYLAMLLGLPGWKESFPDLLSESSDGKILAKRGKAELLRSQISGCPPLWERVLAFHCGKSIILPTNVLIYSTKLRSLRFNVFVRTKYRVWLLSEKERSSQDSSSTIESFQFLSQMLNYCIPRSWTNKQPCSTQLWLFNFARTWTSEIGTSFSQKDGNKAFDQSAPLSTFYTAVLRYKQLRKCISKY